MTRSVILAAVAGAMVLALTGCGGGLLLLNEFLQNDRQHPPLPPQGVQHARQAPIVDLDGTLHVGADVAAPAAALSQGLRARGISTSNGYVNDGVGADTLIAYLEEDASVGEYNRRGHLQRFGNDPPTVLLASGTTAAHRDEVVRAVQLINASLPRGWQLQMSHAPAPALTDERVFVDGAILIHFLPYDEWPQATRDALVGRESKPVGVAPRRSQSTGEFTAAFVFVEHTRTTGEDRLDTIVHEIIHTLGRNHPTASRFPETIMRVDHPETGLATGSTGVPGHILHPLDREALLAVYGWLDPGDAPASIAGELGPWASTSYHIRGDIEDMAGAAFGVAYRNGLSQPWATGPTPWTNLVDNPVLSGSARWEGALMGFDFYTGYHVGSAADLAIDLASLDGVLDFTGMTAWASGDLVGSDTGVMWGDGDLAYTVGVRGNTFVQTGGDEGIVTGAFFGAQHEGAGGTLLRDDLSGAFGATRNQ